MQPAEHAAHLHRLQPLGSKAPTISMWLCASRMPEPNSMQPVDVTHTWFVRCSARPDGKRDISQAEGIPPALLRRRHHRATSPGGVASAPQSNPALPYLSWHYIAEQDRMKAAMCRQAPKFGPASGTACNGEPVSPQVADEFLKRVLTEAAAKVHEEAVPDVMAMLRKGGKMLRGLRAASV